MANLALVYGLRLLPVDELESVEPAKIVLKNGRSVNLTLHLLEGASETEIRNQLMASLDAFFEFYPEL